MSSNTKATIFVVAAAALVSGAACLLARRWRSSYRQLHSRILQLEAAVEASVEQRAAERKGRIRAQQALRKFLVDKDALDGTNASYPMAPIGFMQSCFSTRNGTPRQPLLVPLARACLILSPGGVPATALDGLTEYSHCWLLYIFHANTDLPHIWKQPMHKDFKAKVRVPRLDGGKLGVYATRTPHRPCPIGLTVAKVEGVHGRMLLISGADLVDGTPVLDVKPYLPYCDSVSNARAPSWVKAGGGDDPIAFAAVEFSTSFRDDLSKSWAAIGKHSMYSSPQELQKLIEQVLSRDIRSLRQRRNPHSSMPITSDDDEFTVGSNSVGSNSVVSDGLEAKGRNRANGTVELNTRRGSVEGGLQSRTSLDHESNAKESVVYRLILEGFMITYTVDCDRVMVHGAETSGSRSNTIRECNYLTWMKVAGQSIY